MLDMGGWSQGTLVLDCPTCGSAGAVYRWACEICEVEPRTPPILHPSIPLRFTDVITELRAIADMATETRALDGGAVASACRRAASLLRVLRLQFLEDVVVGQPAGARADPTFTSRSSSRSDRFTSAG